MLLLCGRFLGSIPLIFLPFWLFGNVVVEGAVVTQVDAQTLDMGGHFYWVSGGVKGCVMFDVLLFSTPKQLPVLLRPIYIMCIYLLVFFLFLGMASSTFKY